MAITINSNPSAQHHLAYRPVVWTVSSNDANVVRCIADVYINGVYSTSLDKSPDFGETDVFSFDIQNVLQDNLKAYEPTFTNGAHECVAGTNMALNYDVRFFEVLDNGTTFDTSWSEDGAGTSYTDSNTVYNPSYAFNGTLRHNETQDLSEFQVGGTYGSLSRLYKPTTTFKSNSTNKAKNIKRGDIAVLTGWKNSGSAHRGKYESFDSSENSLGQGTTASISSSSTNVWIQSLDTALLPSNAYNFFMSIEVSGSANRINDYLNFKIVECDNDYISLYWQNDVGGIDYYLFRDGQIKTIGGQTKTYNQPLTSSFNVYDFGETVLSKSNNTEISAVSEVLDRTEADALSNLFTHAVRAWIYDGSNFIPVIVQNGSIESLNTFDGEYRVEINLLYSNKHNAQRY